MKSDTQMNGREIRPDDGQRRDRRLLILAGDPYIRDACGAIADEFDCDLYSTEYIDNFDNILNKFQPKGIVIDLLLFEADAIQLHELLLNAELPLNVLLLEGEDDVLAESTQLFATSIGLNVAGRLRRPVPEDRLEHLLKKIA